MSAEFGLGELASHEFAKDPRTYADAVGQAILSAFFQPRVQTVVNTVGSAGGPNAVDPEFQVWAHTKADIDALVDVVAGMQQVIPTQAVASMVTHAAAVGGAVANTTAAAVWAVMFNARTLFDSEAAIVGAVEVLGQSGSLRSTSSRVTARSATVVRMLVVAQTAAAVVGTVEFAASATTLANTHAALAASARLRPAVQAVTRTQAVLLAAAQTQAISTVWASVRTRLRVSAKVVAPANPQIRIYTVMRAALEAAARGKSAALVNTQATAELVAVMATAGLWYFHTTGHIEAAASVKAVRGSLRLPRMSEAYKTFDRPFVDREFSRPAVTREFVST